MLEAVLSCILTAVFSAMGISLVVSIIFFIIEDRKQAKRNEAAELRDIEYHKKRMNDFK